MALADGVYRVAILAVWRRKSQRMSVCLDVRNGNALIVFHYQADNFTPRVAMPVSRDQLKYHEPPLEGGCQFSLLDPLPLPEDTGLQIFGEGPFPRS